MVRVPPSCVLCTLKGTYYCVDTCKVEKTLPSNPCVEASKACIKASEATKVWETGAQTAEGNNLILCMQSDESLVEDLGYMLSDFEDEMSTPLYNKMWKSTIDSFKGSLCEIETELREFAKEYGDFDTLGFFDDCLTIANTKRSDKLYCEWLQYISRNLFDYVNR